MGWKMTVSGAMSFGIGLDTHISGWAVTQDNTMAIMGGKVGIGVLDPGATFEVGGSAVFNPDLGDYDFRIGGDTDPDVFHVDASEDMIGIGTATPRTLLEVAGDVSADRFLARSGVADVQLADQHGTDGIKVENSDSNPNIWIGDYSVSSANFRGIYVDGASQTVSIGTVDSSNRLVVSSPTNDDTVRLLGPDGGTTAYGARLNFGGVDDDVFIEEDEDDKLYIYGSSRTAIMGGNVGIGETNPQTKLYVDGDVAFGDQSTLDISSGGVEVTHSYHRINAETGSSDDLAAITGGDVAGQILIITAASGDTITVRDGMNLRLAGDFSMDDQDTMVLIYDGTLYWNEISRSEN
jgi:hypothetical protein